MMPYSAYVNYIHYTPVKHGLTSFEMGEPENWRMTLRVFALRLGKNRLAPSHIGFSCNHLFGQRMTAAAINNKLANLFVGYP